MEDSKYGCVVITFIALWFVLVFTIIIPNCNFLAGIGWSLLLAVILLGLFIVILSKGMDKTAKENNILIGEIMTKKEIKPSIIKNNVVGNYFFAVEPNRIWVSIISSQTLVREEFINDFTVDKYIDSFSSITPQYNFFVDSTRDKVAIVLFNDKNIKVNQIDFGTIVSIEQIKNGTTIYKKSTSGAIGRALVGSVVAGGVGAIVGGSTANQTGIEKCTSLITKIQLNDIGNPSIEIVWYKDNEGMQDIENTHYYTQSQKVIDMFKAIIATNETSKNEVSNNNSTVADEITKLHKLMTDDIITKEEFEEQKSKILSR